jgi:hypothetical protein
MPATESTLDFCILNIELSENADNISPDKWKRLATRGRNAEKAFQVDRFGKVLAGIRCF